MLKKTLPLIAAAVILAGFLAGCGAGKEPTAESQKARTDTSRVQTARDPACGMQVPMTEDAVTYNYQGKTYYFCSAECKAEFVADPARYTEGHHEEMHEGM